MARFVWAVLVSLCISAVAVHTGNSGDSEIAAGNTGRLFGASSASVPTAGAAKIAGTMDMPTLAEAVAASDHEQHNVASMDDEDSGDDASLLDAVVDDAEDAYSDENDDDEDFDVGEEYADHDGFAADEIGNEGSEEDDFDGDEDEEEEDEEEDEDDYDDMGGINDDDFDDVDDDDIGTYGIDADDDAVDAVDHEGFDKEDDDDDTSKGFTFSSDVPLVPISGRAAVVAKVQSEKKPGMVIVTSSTCPTCKNLVQSVNQNAKAKADMKNFVAVSAVDAAGEEWKSPGEASYYPRIYFVKRDGSFFPVPSSSSNPQWPHFFSDAAQLDNAMHTVLGQPL
eukprot:TRINITY_DN7810_c0_g1_i1.p1 TRINITY_DN7810_c0_g1~~TRINITY_DN7810_c0_g1_i1.p1  ORF type:complete len:367 (-),score=95.89 TRINITY_DN7810_c0_g1_i1:135-1148(-)